MTSQRAETEAVETESADIAIIGMSCRFPGANNPDEFWARVQEGKEQLTVFSEDELRQAGVPEEFVANASYIRTTSLIDGADRFDAAFFGITPREAELMDPQHRLFLELCWLALENAGYDPHRHSGDIGVFAGAARNTYLRNNVGPLLNAADSLDGSVRGLQADIGNYGDFLATRVSYKLGLQGPSLNVQTACSTSLVAVHLACQSLLSGDSDIALAGGVAVLSPQVNGYFYEEGSISSADGHCRPFDARANGTVFGNGAGVVALKRLDEAQADGDNVIAVIKGSAINNDGGDKMSYSAPGLKGQARVITQALHVAEVDARTIGYVETHGTGTSLGDPLEIAALTEGFRVGHVARPFCAIGAVKAQIGHLGAAAGIAGLIKAALVVHHGVIPPMVNFSEPNARVAFAGSPFYVPTAPSGWTGVRRAAVSSFGIGGTNAHAVLEQPPARATAHAKSAPVPVVLSARTPRDLDRLRTALADHLERRPQNAVADVAGTLALGRARMRHRIGIAASDVREAAERLRALDVEDAVRDCEAATELPVVFAFPGQGSQFAGMTRTLYRTDVNFRTALDRCAAAFAPLLPRDIREVIHAEDGGAESDAPILRTVDRTEWTQPALFAVEYALARSMMDSGITPVAMIGHSVGEYAAACLAGVFSLDDAAKLIAARGTLMERTAPGAMLAVGVDEDRVRPLLPEGVDIAAVNKPGQCVIAGPPEEIARCAASLAAEGVVVSRLKTNRAFHSALVEPVLDEFRAVLAEVAFHRPTLRFVSNLTGDWADPDRVTDPAYWVDHARSPVRFALGARTLHTLGPVVVAEVGPGRTLAGFLRDAAAGVRTVTPWVQGRSDTASMAEVLALLWTHGAHVDWAPRFPVGSWSRAALPGYPFDGASYWLHPPRPESTPDPAPSAGTWLRVPSWAPAPAAQLSAAPRRRHVLALVPTHDDDLLLALSADHEVVPVVAGDLDLDHVADSVDTVVLHTPGRTGVYDPTTDSVRETLRTEVFPLLRIVSALAKRPGTARLDVVVVTGTRPDHCPELALLDGPRKVLPQEYPNVRVTTVRTDQAAQAADELAHLTDGNEVAYLDGVRHVLRHEPADPSGEAPMWRPGGTYLLTGGLGGIGLALAHEAAATPGVTLVLLQRSAPDRKHEQALRLLRAAGAEVVVAEADVTDAVAIRRVRADHGPFTGIVHCAGVPGGRLIEAMDHDEMARVLGPKVDGVLVLDEFAADEHTGWMVLCSSMSSVLGGVGQTAYCSANAFLDAYAGFRTARGRRVQALSFDVWGDVGMAVKAAGDATEAFDHPLFLDRERIGQHVVYRTRFSRAADWVVDEHRVGEHGLLPGTAIVEYLRAAAADHLGADHIEITGLDLLRPVVVPEGTEIETEIRVDARAGEVSLHSRLPGRSWALHAHAGIAVFNPDATSGADLFPPDAVGRQGTAPRSDMLTFGPRWDNVVRTAAIGADEVHAECALAERFGADTERFGLHPALLDTAAGALVASLGQSVHLPMSYERIRVHRGMPGLVRSRTVRRVGDDGVLRLDVLVLTEDGEPVVEFEGYTLRRIDGAAPGFDPDVLAGPANERLAVESAGDLSTLRFVPSERAAPRPDEVEIEVVTTGLNFKEVLIATGMLDLGGDFRYGLECAGVVSAVGSAVTTVRPGDAVMALGESCFSRYAVVKASLTAPIPADTSFSQATSIPVAFATAYDALVNLGRLRRGERVLIHSATGGVGLAALQVAAHVGAEVIASAGSPRKRELLAAMGVTAVVDSRSPDFEADVIASGGVDVVLNSLAGDRIAAGLRTLRPYGRFVEIGKRDVLAGTMVDLRLLEHGISFSVYNPDTASAAFAACWQKVADLVRRGVLKPLPVTEFAVEDVAGAFTHMSRGQHIGKVVVVREHAHVPRDRSREDAPAHQEVITSATGTAAVRRAFALAAPHVLVTPRREVSGSDDLLVAGHVLEAMDTARSERKHSRGDLPYDFVAPEGDTEQVLADIWSDLLGIAPVGRMDRFLDLGGDSLGATQVVARVRARLGVRIGPADVLEDQPLRKLAAVLDERVAVLDEPAAAGTETGFL
ncbi:SDR family NAD(P)-dependent oxidoreductase [Lentzea sp. BCCO 10_0061]|uniref:SDR family NAD(P)-dependent oxidoreductase n=1 Tax=Lentzea sokolovensis TaxID=3095429 RepID=A0ABU4V6X1_9PSEU|nr:SDR family NAD(P)-dependent oxidoreductase [Lentzea sp. BCCO 10_0061]MDX8147107.1 SDR family NAD(P)-dependent oxidoreductase [Lentzea sp. BCCO 10_0061]